MVTQLKSADQKDIIYPDSEGQPMADNTQQFELIVWIKQNLELSPALETKLRELGIEPNQL